MYRCPACSYKTDRLSVGWGKSGRAAFWGGLALCTACENITVVNLAEKGITRSERRCTACSGPLKLLEGTADRIGCPRCRRPLDFSNLGTWD